MNGTYFKNGAFTETPDNNLRIDTPNLNKEFYISVLKLNIGKKVKVCNTENKIFSGILEGIEYDHLVLSDPSNGSWYLILTKTLNHIEFEEKMTY